ARRLRLLPDQVLEERQERRLRLPDAGRGHQEDVRPRQDPGDRLDLRLREFVDPQGLDRVEDGGIEAEGLHGGRLKGSSDYKLLPDIRDVRSDGVGGKKLSGRIPGSQGSYRGRGDGTTRGS